MTQVTEYLSLRGQIPCHFSKPVNWKHSQQYRSHKKLPVYTFLNNVSPFWNYVYEIRDWELRQARTTQNCKTWHRYRHSSTWYTAMQANFRWEKNFSEKTCLSFTFVISNPHPRKRKKFWQLKLTKLQEQEFYIVTTHKKFEANETWTSKYQQKKSQDIDCQIIVETSFENFFKKSNKIEKYFGKSSPFHRHLPENTGKSNFLWWY